MGARFVVIKFERALAVAHHRDHFLDVLVDAPRHGRPARIQIHREEQDAAAHSVSKITHNFEASSRQVTGRERFQRLAGIEAPHRRVDWARAQAAAAQCLRREGHRARPCAIVRYNFENSRQQRLP